MRMRMTLALALLGLLAPVARAQQSTDEAAVRAVVARETEGWDKFDAKEVASVFTEDAVWQNPFGVRLHGRPEIEKFLTELMTRPGYRAGKDTSPTKILDLRMTSPTTAAVWSDEKSEGQTNDVSGNPMQPRHSYYLEVLIKKDGSWMITDSLIMDIIHLK
jgi:uncharacterized protein (TIGR02246 family)